MLLGIQHRTELTYGDRVSESVMELRVTPRSDKNQTLRAFNLKVGPEAPVFSHRDWMDNQAHHFTIVAFHERVVIVAGATVETHPNLVELASAADPLPLTDLNPRFQDFLGFLGPVQRDPRLVQFAEQVGLFQCSRAAEAVLLVMTRLRERIEYKKGVTSSATTVSDALDVGQGVCQDFSHLGLALLRLIGIPARYVSGYLYRETPRELETHAWCEAFVPSIGWVGVDPTHGELASEGHVAVAVGRSYADVPPNRGVYRGEAEEKIAVKVTIDRLDDSLAAHAPMSPGSFD
ncbi:MAG TPA: transglutaminase family protein, partial [Polyangiaceae bacterium]|nr:transglutaminase family protein [Polyangiaceae bacterium]